MTQLHNDSPIGRLLEELSWEGNARRYRFGGRGLENVLVTEVFLALDLLPRDLFLGEILRQSHGASVTRHSICRQIEQASVEVLPGGPDLATGGPNIQPDAMLNMPGATILVEAKRIRSGSFQPEQLAREYLSLIRDSHTSEHLLLLLLASPPPILVRGLGRLSVRDAILNQLPLVHSTATDAPPLHQLIANVDDSYAWITWTELERIVNKQAKQFTNADDDVTSAIRRTAAFISRAVAWHT